MSRVRRLARFAVALGALATAATLLDGPAAAHGLNMSQLRLRVDGARVEGAWEVGLRDARMALGLDPGASGDAAVEEVRSRAEALHDYLAQRVTLTEGAAECRPDSRVAPLGWQRDQGLIVVPFGADCPGAPSHLGLRCELMFDVEPKHRAYWALEDARVTHLGAFRDDQRSAIVDIRRFDLRAGFLEFVREGITHIWTGVDHLLFLLTLLLPAPLAWGAATWSPKATLRQTAREVLGVVTAFTLAHSLTLCLSFFGVLAPSARWVEVGIAGSVLAAAWNNLRPFLPGRGWLMALAFGLVHGLGFSGALRNLALPIHARGLALAAFNIGVELGQLAIVAVVLPPLYWASRRRSYPRLVLGAGSFGIAWLAAVWTIERAFGLSLLPWS
jgi:hypothetical protein